MVKALLPAWWLNRKTIREGERRASMRFLGELVERAEAERDNRLRKELRGYYGMTNAEQREALAAQSDQGAA